MLKFEGVGELTKFQTKSSGGGSISISIDLALNEDNAKMAMQQGKLFAFTMDFTSLALEEAEGQNVMEF